jgi:hypothetical protein
LSGSDKAGHRKAGNDSVASKSETRKRKKGKSASGPIGRALRSVYDDTLREDVPADFIDLLGKLA